MNDFIYVPVGKDEFNEIMKGGDLINLVGGRDIKGEPRWLKKVPASEYLKSICLIQEVGYCVMCSDMGYCAEHKVCLQAGQNWPSIQEDWKGAVINEAKKRFPVNTEHKEYMFKMPSKIHRQLCRERFMEAAEWAKQYIEENIINKRV